MGHLHTSLVHRGHGSWTLSNRKSVHLQRLTVECQEGTLAPTELNDCYSSGVAFMSHCVGSYSTSARVTSGGVRFP